MTTTTTAAYLSVTQNLARYQAMTAAEPAVKSATAYYQANIGKVTSIQDFVGNYRLLSYALSAYGLGDQINNRALIAKVLEGGVSNPKSLANTLKNASWKAFATAFDFLGKGVASVSSPGAVGTTTTDYVEQQLESDQGAQNVGVELALYFQRVAPTVTNDYGILADQNLLEVAQTIFGLSPATSATNIDTQAKILSKLMPVTDLQDPTKLRHLTQRFTAMYDLTYGPEFRGDDVAFRVIEQREFKPVGGVRGARRGDRLERGVDRNGAQSLHRRADINVLQRADDQPAEVHPGRIVDRDTREWPDAPTGRWLRAWPARLAKMLSGRSARQALRARQNFSLPEQRSQAPCSDAKRRAA